MEKPKFDNINLFNALDIISSPLSWGKPLSKGGYNVDKLLEIAEYLGYNNPLKHRRLIVAFLKDHEKELLSAPEPIAVAPLAVEPPQQRRYKIKLAPKDKPEPEPEDKPEPEPEPVKIPKNIRVKIPAGWRMAAAANAPAPAPAPALAPAREEEEELVNVDLILPKIEDISDVSGQFKKLQFVHNTNMDTFLKMLSGEYTYIRALDAFGRPIGRGAQFRYGLDSQYGDVKLIMKPDFNIVCSKGVTHDHIITDEPVYARITDLAKHYNKSELEKELKQDALNYTFRKYANTRNFNNYECTLPKPPSWCNIQVQLGCNITFDYIQYVILPGFLKNMVVNTKYGSMPFSELLVKHEHPAFKDKLIFGPNIPPIDYYSFISERLHTTEFYAKLIKKYPTVLSDKKNILSGVRENVRRNPMITNNSSLISVSSKAFLYEEQIYMNILALKNISQKKYDQYPQQHQQRQQRQQRQEQEKQLDEPKFQIGKVVSCDKYYCKLSKKSFAQLCADKNNVDFVTLLPCDESVDTINDWVITKCCGAFVRKDSYDESLKHVMKCPLCNKLLGIILGDQPSGSMYITLDKTINIIGATPGIGTIVITYRFVSGYTPKGKKHGSATRVAYIPNDAEGNEIVLLLVTAFKRGLIFAAGTSITSGFPDQVVWTTIHHRTSPHGGPHGYNAPGDILSYYVNVRDELKNRGVTEPDFIKSDLREGPYHVLMHI